MSRLSPNLSHYSLRLYEELIAKDVHSTKWEIAIRPEILR